MLSPLVIAALSLGCQNFLVDGEQPDGGAGAPRDDAGERIEGTDDGGSSCSFAPGRTSGPKVRVVYLVPSDREVDPRQKASLELAVRHVQLWMYDHLDGSTFDVHDPVVEVVETSHPSAWYATNPTPAGFVWYFWDNVTADGFALKGGQFDDEDDLWLFYPAADSQCDQVGGGADDGVGTFTENDLRGLVGEPRVPSCEGQLPDLYGRCRWAGGMALHLVRALGLEYPIGCIDDDDGTPCDGAHLTIGGYIDYPNARLTAEDAEFLQATAFFESRSLPDCELDCSALAD